VAAKLVFASQMIGIYLSGEELREWFELGGCEVELYIGKQRVGAVTIAHEPDDPQMQTVRGAWRMERQEIDRARSKLLDGRLPPNPIDERKETTPHD
jgi:hypothetical protein